MSGIRHGGDCGGTPEDEEPKPVQLHQETALDFGGWTAS